MSDLPIDQADEPRPLDLGAEAKRIVAAGQSAELPMRLLGGVAVRLRCPSAQHRALRRSYGDIDLCAFKRDVPRLADFFETLEYEPWLPFNQLNAEHSQRFDHGESELSIDVFLDRLSMCHSLDLRSRLTMEPLTLPLADLLLSKLQIVHLTEKDIQDIFALLRDHRFGMGAGDAIELERIIDVCSSDWGWYRTTIGTIATCQQHLSRFLDDEDEESISMALARMNDAIEAAPKSRRWKLRSRIGERRVWYELPEDPTRKA